MAMTLDDLMLMLPEQRRRLRLRKKYRGPYEKRPERSREELIRYLRASSIKSANELRAKRKPLEPHVHDYFRAFGSFMAAKSEAYGPEPPSPGPPATHDYLTKVCLEFSIWSQGRWNESRRKRPDVIPSSNQVKRLFGGFSNLFEMAQRVSLRRTLERYLVLRAKYGRWLNSEELRTEGLDLTVAIKVLGGSKWHVDRFLDGAMAAHNKRHKEPSSASAPHFERASRLGSNCL